MQTRELFHHHSRTDFENWARDRRYSVLLPDCLLCRVLNRHNLYVDPANLDMTPWLVLDGYWEAWISMAIGRTVQPGWTCVDVGAWCGYFSVLMGDLTGPTGRVLAFEPNPLHRMLCNRSLKANGIAWGHCHEAAVTGKKGKGKFWASADGGGSRLAPEGDISVRTGTLDEVLQDAPRVDFIKMDIEGGERAAWQGMQKTVKKHPNLILMLEWDAGRYKDAGPFAEELATVYQLREVNYEGNLEGVTVDDLQKPGLRMLWLQR